MTYTEAIAYLDSLAQFGWKLDLARIERLCELAGHPERRFRSILVGGSAGKGSTCAILASILRAAGRRVGTAPKPHLHTHRERVQVDGELISEERFAELMGRIVPLAAQVTREEGSPTVFEVMTLLAFLHFAESRIDWAVVEVGLGGRFDATNVLPAELSIITNIGLDHTDRLGETVEEIAFEKAGIIKPGGKLVTGATGGALRVIENMAGERGSAVRRLGVDILVDEVRVEPSATEFDLTTREGTLVDLTMGLAGAHQAQNAALAVAAGRWLEPLTEDQIRGGLERAAIPGRLQVLGQRPLVIVDGAHSPDRAAALAAAIRQLHPGRRTVLVLGCSQGHAPPSVVAQLAPLASEVVATRSTHPAAIPAVEIAAAAEACGVPARVHDSVAEALAAALALAAPDDLVLITGSLFVVGEAIRAFHERTAGES